jgi:hypothetical protein
MKKYLLAMVFITLTMSVMSQSDYDCIGRDEFFIVKTDSDAKNIAKLKVSEIKSINTVEQLYGKNFKAKRYFDEMYQEYHNKIVYDNGLELELAERGNWIMNFHITTDEYTMILSDGQEINVGMKADVLKGMFPKSFSKRTVIQDIEGMTGKITIKVDFSITRNNIVYHEDNCICFILSGENGVLDEFYFYERP